jgi:hypothetical protein
VGIENHFPAIPKEDKQFVAAVELSMPVETIGQVVFILRSMLDHLSKQLLAQSLQAEEITLCLRNEHKVIDERVIQLIKPSTNVKFLLEVIRLALESSPPQSEFNNIECSISKFDQESLEQKQLDDLEAELSSISSLSQSSSLASSLVPSLAPSLASSLASAPSLASSLPSSPSLLLLLQRFVSRLGHVALSYAKTCDQYAPEEAAVWVPILEDNGEVRGKSGKGNSKLTNDSTVKNTNNGAAINNTIFINDYLESNKRLPDDTLFGGVVLKSLSAPQPIWVSITNDLPDTLCLNGQWYDIKEITNPETLSLHWWQRAIHKSYCMALIEPRPFMRTVSQLSFQSVAKQQSMSDQQARASSQQSSQQPSQQHVSNQRSIPNQGVMHNEQKSTSNDALMVLLTCDHENDSWFLEGYFD